MIARILRILWRIIILALGASALWLAIAYLVPYIDTRLPLFFALLIVYCLFVYVVIPSLIRLFRVFIKPNHIPHYAVTGDGWPSDPVNIALVTRNKRHLQEAMRQAGWFEADPGTLTNSLREAWSILFNKPYPNAPVSTLYLFNRKHDIAFQLPANDKMSARTRHHVRFWKLEEPKIEKTDHGHFMFWSKKLMKWLGFGNEIWIGASTYDFKPLDIRWRTGSLTHGVHHEADLERDFIISTLREAGLVRSTKTSEPGDQFKFRGQSFRTIFTTDGSLEVVRIR